jgi:hypothetical protein
MQGATGVRGKRGGQRQPAVTDFVEVLQDSALAPLPVTAQQARTLLEKLRGSAVLRGTRGAEPADLDGLCAVVARR